MVRSVMGDIEKGNIEEVHDLLRGWLFQRLSTEAFEGLSFAIAQSRQCGEQTFLSAFSAIPRQVGKQELGLNAAELQSADRLCLGWNPQEWSVDIAARSLLLLSLPQAEKGELNNLLSQLYRNAGISESIALCQTLPLLPYGDRYLHWALEGFRSQITTVFNAIALRNPYPFHQFDEADWNQLVLKAVFVGSPLDCIWGLHERANAKLSKMLLDYVAERRAAHREVKPELWSLIYPQTELDSVARAAQISV